MLVLATLVGSAHEVFVVQPALFVDAGASPGRPLIGVTGLGAIGLGVLLQRRAFADAFGALPWLLAVAALAVGSSPAVLHAAFARGAPTAAASLTHAFFVGVALGAVTGLGVRALGRTLVRLDVPWRLANPFRLLAVAVMCGTAAGVASVVGPLRAAITLGTLLAAFGAWTPTLRWFLERRGAPGSGAARWALLGLVASGFGAFLLAERVIPTSELGRYPNPVVFHRETERASYSVTTGQDAVELWVDGRLKASTLDESRYFEALVHPTLALAERRARVLLLGGGTGLAEREILKHPEVESLTVVVVDRGIVELAEKQRWLTSRSGGALASPLVRIVEREPILWLGEASERFDVAIVDLPDPDTHVEGKNFTRFFYQRLRERLTPEGVCVVQATSPFAAPTAFDSIVTTLRAAGLEPRPYRAAVPSLGEWGFVIGFVHAPARVSFEAALPWLSGTTLGELGHMPKDLAAKTPGRAATLHDQNVVEEWHKGR